MMQSGKSRRPGFPLIRLPQPKPISIRRLRKTLTACPRCGKQGYSKMAGICLECGYDANIAT